MEKQTLLQKTEEKLRVSTEDKAYKSLSSRISWWELWRNKPFYKRRKKN